MTIDIDVTSWLPNLLGPVNFMVNGVLVSIPRRQTINLVNATVADNKAFDRTDITIIGSALHQEPEAVFRDPSDTATALADIPALGEARSTWRKLNTTGATPTVIHTFVIPVAEWHDCEITLQVRVTVSDAVGGGVINREIRLRRSEDSLEIKSQSDPLGDLDIVVSFEAVIVDNDSFVIKVTGIAATSINWFGSSHIQVVRVPS